MTSNVDTRPERSSTCTLHGTVMMVADGLGPSSQRCRASQLVIDEMLRQIQGNLPWGGDETLGCSDQLGFLTAAAEACAERLWTECGDWGDSDHDAPCSTLTMVCTAGSRAYVLHAGDSRCYLSRHGRLFKITTDHTLGHKIAANQGSDPELAEGSLLSYVLLNAIGRGEPRNRVDTRAFELLEGDTLLLCTDGLARAVCRERIDTVLRTAPTAREATARLIEGAAVADARDNATAVVARF